MNPLDRAWLAAVLTRLPRNVLRDLRLLVRPETVLRWHRYQIARRHAKISRPQRAGRPRTVRSIRRMVLRLARESTNWGSRRIHGSSPTCCPTYEQLTPSARRCGLLDWFALVARPAARWQGRRRG